VLLIAHTRLLNAMRTSSFSQALIKIYVALYLPNLFSCQISSSGEASLVVGRWPIAKTYAYDFHPARVCGYGSYSVRGVQTPHFLQPNVRRQNDFHWTVNRITVVAFDAQHQADSTSLRRSSESRRIRELRIAYAPTLCLPFASQGPRREISSLPQSKRIRNKPTRCSTAPTVKPSSRPSAAP
jgi:hypothetical protein